MTSFQFKFTKTYETWILEYHNYNRYNVIHYTAHLLSVPIINCFLHEVHVPALVCTLLLPNGMFKVTRRKIFPNIIMKFYPDTKELHKRAKEQRNIKDTSICFSQAFFLLLNFTISAEEKVNLWTGTVNLCHTGEYTWLFLLYINISVNLLYCYPIKLSLIVKTSTMLVFKSEWQPLHLKQSSVAFFYQK